MCLLFWVHYSDVIMSMMVCQITSVSIVCLTICSGADQRKHQSSVSLAFVRGIHRWPVNSPHKGPVRRKMFSNYWRHHELHLLRRACVNWGSHCLISVCGYIHTLSGDGYTIRWVSSKETLPKCITVYSKNFAHCFRALHFPFFIKNDILYGISTDDDISKQNRAKQNSVYIWWDVL